jgi:hypothetical protein
MKLPEFLISFINNIIRIINTLLNLKVQYYPMVAARHNLIIEQGATFMYDVLYRENGEVVDLTGYTSQMHIRKSLTDPNFVIELTTENNRISIDGSIGKISLYISAADTRLLNFETGVYDLEITSPSPNSRVTRLMEGSVTFSKEVTR